MELAIALKAIILQSKPIAPKAKRLHLLAIALRTTCFKQRVSLQQLQAIAFRQAVGGCDQFACIPGVSGGCWRFGFAIAVMVGVALGVLGLMG